MTTERKDGQMKIRYRTRRGYAREAQGYTTWNEYQVVQGRKVLSRHDTEEQAQRWIAEAAQPKP